MRDLVGVLFQVVLPFAVFAYAVWVTYKIVDALQGIQTRLREIRDKLPPPTG